MQHIIQSSEKHGTEMRVCQYYNKRKRSDGTVRLVLASRTYTVQSGARTIRKLSDEDCDEIRADYIRGVPMTKIGLKYDISARRVKSVCAGVDRG